jgi:hypothetical protein
MEPERIVEIAGVGREESSRRVDVERAASREERRVELGDALFDQERRFRGYRRGKPGLAGVVVGGRGGYLSSNTPIVR